MNRRDIILDFSDPKTWKSRVRRIINCVFPKEVQEWIWKRNPDDLYDDTFDYAIEAFAKYGEVIEFDEINARLDSEFATIFTHYRGYHSCRPLSLESYHKNGIIPLTRELLLKEALRAFKGKSPADEIAMAVAGMELTTREHLIYFFCDRVAPLERSSNHYLQSGSEALGALACKLKLHCRGILAAQGKAHILQCKVPVGAVRTVYRECLYRKLTTLYFQHEMSDAKTSLAIESSCFASGDILMPSNIERVIPIDDGQLVYGWQPVH